MNTDNPLVMNTDDPLFQALRGLPTREPPAILTQTILGAGRARLRTRPVSKAWTVILAAVVGSYLGWAVLYTSQLY